MNGLRRAVLVAIGLALASPAHAVECAVPAGAAAGLGLVPAGQRLEYVRSELRHAARRSRIWSYLWLAFYGGGTTLELTLAAVVPRDARIDFYVGGAASVLGIGAQLVLAPRIIADQRALEARLALAGPAGDTCALLADAERVLYRDAASEHEGGEPLLHGAVFLVNIAAGLVIGIFANRWPSALVQIFAGSAIGELTMLTQPTDSRDVLRRYRSGDFASRHAAIAPDFALAPSIAPGRYGLDLTLSF